MSEDNQALHDRPVVIHPGPGSIEDLLKYTDPAPDDETERFVAAIYQARRDASRQPSSR